MKSESNINDKISILHTVVLSQICTYDVVTRYSKCLGIL
jgi:hypothetical protein